MVMKTAAIAFDGESSYVFIESDFDLNERQRMSVGTSLFI